jgi:peptidoglycan/xylan/chitin deacetylase (PgdA/CDA1 family)
MSRLTVCLSFDFDAVSVWLKSRNPSERSRGEFGAVAVPRILRMLRGRGIEATFFVPGHTAIVYPHLIHAILEDGHEIAHHGWLHENPVDLDESQERKALERGIEALEQAGAPRPTGWRSPAWAMSEASIPLLLEFGFAYDSSLMGHDFEPYYVRNGDVWSTDGSFSLGDPCNLVELPVYWGLDDFPAFEFVAGRNPGLRAPSAVLEIWQGDLDYAHRECPGGVYTLTMHPQVIGRGHRLLMLEQLLDHMQSLDGVRFDRMDATAEAWRRQQQTQQQQADPPTP